MSQAKKARGVQLWLRLRADQAQPDLPDASRVQCVDRLSQLLQEVVSYEIQARRSDDERQDHTRAS